MAETDAERGHAALHELAYRSDCVFARLGIAGSIRQEDAMGIERNHVTRRRLGRYDGEAASSLREQTAFKTGT